MIFLTRAQEFCSHELTWLCAHTHAQSHTLQHNPLHPRAALEYTHLMLPQSFLFPELTLHLMQHIAVHTRVEEDEEPPASATGRCATHSTCYTFNVLHIHVHQPTKRGTRWLWVQGTMLCMISHTVPQEPCLWCQHKHVI